MANTYISRLRVPQLDGWFAKESITVVAPDGQANVIVSTEPVDHTIDSRRYADSQGALLRAEFAGYREISHEAHPVFGGRGGFVRTFEWHPPDGVPVMQIQMYFAAAGRGYTATATTAATQFARLEADLRSIMGGIVIVDYT